MIERSRVPIPAGAAGEFYSPGWTFCADSESVSILTVFRDQWRKQLWQCKPEGRAPHGKPHIQNGLRHRSRKVFPWCSNGSKFVTDNLNYIRRFLFLFFL